MNRLREVLGHLRRDDGIVFLAPILFGLMVGGLAVGGGSAVEAVNNSSTIARANKDLQTQMAWVVQETNGKTDERSVETNQKARELLGVAKQLEQENFDKTLTDVRDAEISVVSDVGSTLIGGPASAISDVQTVWKFGEMAGENDFSPPFDERTKDYIKRVNSVRFRVTTRELEAGGEAGLAPVPSTPLEGAIAETKIDVAQREIVQVTGVKAADARKLAEAVALDAEENLPKEMYNLPLDDFGDEAKDMKTWEVIGQLPDFPDFDGLPEDALENRQPDRAEYDEMRGLSVGRLLDTVEDSVDKVDPSKAKGEKGEIVLWPDDEKALKSGDKKTAVGTFISPMGPQPVIVNAGKGNEFIGTFPTMKSAPSIKSGPTFQLPKKAWQSWWDGSRSSCPFVYAFDGEGFSAVNDIISVSRDPKREYPDSMLFAALPSPNGMLELAVREIRAEESFLDCLRLRAVDVPDGFVAALSPAGDAFSVRDAAPPIAATGTSVAALTFVDREGFAAYDGRAVTAEFAAEGPDAVLLLTVDGFEHDASTPLFTPKQPAIRVEAFAGDAWHSVGEAHPRDLADTTAYDVARFVRNGRVRVRVTGVSCDSSVFQLIDRLALSSAPSDLARLRDLAPSVIGPAADAAALLWARDDRRVHLTPGQELRFRVPDPRADAYVVESVGWYRELRPARR